MGVSCSAFHVLKLPVTHVPGSYHPRIFLTFKVDPNGTNLSHIWYQNDEKHAPGWWATQ